MVTVDQLRPDYLDRYRSQLNAGLARLLKDAATFTDAHQDHAITETAPGHASTLSGRFPRSTGITRNILGVNTDSFPLLGVQDLGAAPDRFRGTTLVDWLTAADSKTKALSVSHKDRAAILPIGRSKQQVYWYSGKGAFTTSSWYADSLPAWVNEFNARRLPQRFAGQFWETLLPAAQYPERDSVPIENFGRNFLFPHPFPADSNRAASLIRLYPMMDELTLQLALEGVKRLDLGKGPQTDVLAIGLSTTDLVGHAFGPQSRELHDQILRLDRYLGSFLDSLFTIRDPARILIALTADHGVYPIPELNNALRVSMDPAVQAARDTVKAGGGDTTIVDLESGALFIDPAKLGTRGLTVDRVVNAFAGVAKKTPGVLRVDRWADFARADTTKDYVARRWLHMFPDDMLPAATVTLKPGSMWDYPVVATHGSPHELDSHVPLLFVGPPFKPGRYKTFARTVDIAPTLARALGITPGERLDGRVLDEAFHP